ncbi:hypothetical protein [Fusobacterium sp. PH5-44]|uniref:hypothetical protein n=1 Tax=unclassified Fusobacterium TaxID=2648384 RepID=UPI003D1A628F
MKTVKKLIYLIPLNVLLIGINCDNILVAKNSSRKNQKSQTRVVSSFNMDVGISFLRSIMQDMLDGKEKPVKKDSYDEYKSKNGAKAISRDKYYTEEGYTLRVPTYIKGQELNKYIVDKFVLPNLNRKHTQMEIMSSFVTAMDRIASNPSVLEDYYVIQENSDNSEKEKYLIFGHVTKDGKYNDSVMEGMYIYPRVRVGVLKIKIIKSEI